MPGRLTRRSDFLRVAGESARTRSRVVTEGVILQAARRPASEAGATEADAEEAGAKEAKANGNKQVDAREAGMDPGPRFGFTATKKIGGAVVRNRVKRRLRAVAREISANADPRHDYVLIGRTTTASRDFALLRRDIESALRRLKLWHEADEASSRGSQH